MTVQVRPVTGGDEGAARGGFPELDPHGVLAVGDGPRRDRRSGL